MISNRSPVAFRSISVTFLKFLGFENSVYFLDMQDEEISSEEQERVEGSKMEMDRYLGAYPYERLVCKRNLRLETMVCVLLTFTF